MALVERVHLAIIKVQMVQVLRFPALLQQVAVAAVLMLFLLESLAVRAAALEETGAHQVWAVVELLIRAMLAAMVILLLVPLVAAALGKLEQTVLRRLCQAQAAMVLLYL